MAGREVQVDPGETLGVAAGYTHTDIGEEQTGDSGTIDALRVALYGVRWFGPVGVSATVGYALDFLSQTRPFGALGTAEGDHIGNEFTAAGQASLPLAPGRFVVTPRMGLRTRICTLHVRLRRCLYANVHQARVALRKATGQCFSTCASYRSTANGASAFLVVQPIVKLPCPGTRHRHEHVRGVAVTDLSYRACRVLWRSAVAHA